jgi:hypothetical protein
MLPALLKRFKMNGSAMKDIQSGDNNTVECLALFHKIVREWSRYLSPYEFMVVMQIMDRSVGWNKPDMQCATSLMLNGHTLYRGMLISRRQYFYALQSLEDKGAIRRSPDPKNPDRTRMSVNRNWEPEAMIAVPKRLQNAPENDQKVVQEMHSPVQDMHRVVQEMHPNIDHSLEIIPYSSDADRYAARQRSRFPGKESSSAPSEPPHEDVPQICLNPMKAVSAKVERTMIASAERRVFKTEAAKKDPKAGSRVLEQIWTDALRETFPVTAHVGWSPRERGQITNKSKNWLWADDITFADMIDWSVRNWTQIIKAQFAWMKDSPPPAVPAVSFFCHFVAQFVECWAEKKLDAWLKSDEATDIDKMMARGMTREEALVEIAKGKAVTSIREEVDQKTKTATTRLRRAEQIEKQNQRLSALGPAPIHPRSRAAQQSRQQNLQHVAAKAPDDFVLNVPMVDPAYNPFD